MIRVADIALGEKIFEYVDPDAAIPADFLPILNCFLIRRQFESP
jgi:hypothetical protein